MQIFTNVIVINSYKQCYFLLITCFTKIKFVHLYKICFMWAKIEILCQKYNLKASELAKRLEVDPSVLSHLKTGRNKPKSDFIIKLLRAYPDINPDWLLLDSDQMMRSEASDDNLFSTPSLPDHQITAGNEMTGSTESSTEPELEFASIPESCVAKGAADQSQADDQLMPFVATAGKRIERVIVLYTDKSFESYSPLSK